MRLTLSELAVIVKRTMSNHWQRFEISGRQQDHRFNSEKFADAHLSSLKSIKLEVAKLEPDQLEYAFGRLIRLYFANKGKNTRNLL